MIVLYADVGPLADGQKSGIAFVVVVVVVVSPALSPSLFKIFSAASSSSTPPSSSPPPPLSLPVSRKAESGTHPATYSTVKPAEGHLHQQGRCNE